MQSQDGCTSTSKRLCTANYAMQKARNTGTMDSKGTKKSMEPLTFSYQPISPEDCYEQHAGEKWLPQGPKLFASDPVWPAWACSSTPA